MSRSETLEDMIMESFSLEKSLQERYMIMESFSLEMSLQERFIGKRMKVGGNAGALGDSIFVTCHNSKINVSSDFKFSKRYYSYLPPISKAYLTACLLFTTAFHLGLYDLSHIALSYEYLFKYFQVWRLITNFFFLGEFSINFGIHLLMIPRYVSHLERIQYIRRRQAGDFLRMMIFGAALLLVLSAAIPIFRTPFLGISLVFMLLYLVSRDFPDAEFGIYGLFALKIFYLPWVVLALDAIFGSPLTPCLLGIVAGHLYYFLTKLHGLAT